MFCTNCGNKITKLANFCSNCGFETENSKQPEENQPEVVMEVKETDDKFTTARVIISAILIWGLIRNRISSSELLSVQGEIIMYLGVIGVWIYHFFQRVFSKLTRLELAVGISKFNDKKGRKKKGPKDNKE